MFSMQILRLKIEHFSTEYRKSENKPVKGKTKNC